MNQLAMTTEETTDKTHRAIEAVWRIESAKIIATIARMVRDVGIAEEIAQETLVSALERWPQSGVPDNPGAWLTAAGKNRALDWLRRQTLLERKHEELGHELDLKQRMAEPGLEAAVEDDIGDDLLRLMFVACHPVLSTEARAALTLRLLGGLTTDEIARAFLFPEPTIAQRIVRAKRALAEARVPFAVPRKEELGTRLSSVLEVLYLIFNEGYAATTGEDWMRPALCDEALRLARILAELMPAESEVHGLAALMEIQASRTRARIGPRGEPILLMEQDRARWDQLLIRRGLAALVRAETLVNSRPGGPVRATDGADRGAPDSARHRTLHEAQAGAAAGRRRRIRQAAGSPRSARPHTPAGTHSPPIPALYQALPQPPPPPGAGPHRAGPTA